MSRLERLGMLDLGDGQGEGLAADPDDHGRLHASRAGSRIVSRVPRPGSV